MMTLVRWRPAWDMMAMQNDMNRLVNEFFRASNGDKNGWQKGSWTPAVDLYESDQAVMLKAELPGFSTEDVHVEIQDNVLTIKGERKSEIKKEQYHRVERAYGAFQRSFVLPALVDPNKAEATFKAGVLELKLPKAEEAKPKRIGITA
jgi:HSP20 family protein